MQAPIIKVSLHMGEHPPITLMILEVQDDGSANVKVDSPRDLKACMLMKETLRIVAREATAAAQNLSPSI
jgi:hypothetical protein